MTSGACGGDEGIGGTETDNLFAIDDENCTNCKMQNARAASSWAGWGSEIATQHLAEKSQKETWHILRQRKKLKEVD